MIGRTEILNATILIVDDKQANITLLETMLHDEGYRSLSSTNDPGAVAGLYRRHRYDLILLDLHMPVMDGFQVMDQLMEVESEGYLPVLVLTAQPDLKLRALKGGAKDFISKPFDLAEVLIRVHNMIEVRLLHVNSRRINEQLVIEKQHSEQLLQIFRSGPIIMSTSSVSGKRIIDVNEQFCRFYGYTREEVIGRSELELGMWPDPADRSRIIQRLMNSGAIHHFSTTQRCKSGEIRDILASFESIELAGEQEPVIISMFEDITERKRADDLVMKLKQAIITSGESIFLTDRAGIFTFVNPGFTRLYGYTSEEIVGTATPRILKSGSNNDGNYKLFWEQLLHGKVLHNEMTNKRKDGVMIDIAGSASAVVDEKNEIIGFLGIQQDITERRMRETALRNSEEQLRLIYENIDDMIAVLDLDGNRLQITPSYRTLFGGAETVIGTDFFREVHPDDRDQARKIFSETLRSGASSLGEYRLIAPDKKEHLIESRGSVIRDEHGAVVRIIFVSRDVTEKRRNEKQLLRMQRMDGLGTLAGGIAHDLNNILGPITLSLQMLRKFGTEPQFVRLLDMLEGNANRGAALVKQILTFARGGEGERMMIQIRYPIEELISFARETFPSTISVHESVPKDLWVINADPTQIRQVLLNLIVNARDAMPQGGTLSIAAMNILLDTQYAVMNPAASAGPFLMLSVTDTGAGIPIELQDKIFEPFFTTKAVGTGTGLGLATVLSIVKHHNGFIELISQQGKGTTMKVFIPALMDAEMKERSPDAPRIHAGHGECILLVDDECTMREVSKLSLESNGYSVLLAEDGIEAVSLFARHLGTVDVVITDMTMPNMDGLMLIRTLQKMDPSVPVIGTSGSTDQLKLCEIQQLKLTRFLPKPFTAETLLMAIDTVLTKEVQQCH
ncbi:MAG: PAS domain S-box protein [Bacteroidetes bacterium]|nr:PAS domain S-box protein [Bacteroidota bacterium]